MKKWQAAWTEEMGGLDVPWSFIDMTGLAALTDGANKWITVLEESTFEL